jgi:pimeloyl-ACP methyl ester carboxylesterase
MFFGAPALSYELAVNHSQQCATSRLGACVYLEPDMNLRVGFAGLLSAILVAACCLAVTHAEAQDGASALAAGLSKDFASSVATVNGTTLHYVRGGKGPALILIHGFPQDWYEYHAIMPRLAKQFTVIAVDLRGIGGSSAAAGGYDAANLAEDVHQLATALQLHSVYVVGHDIGGPVAFAFALRYPDTARGVMILDAVLPGIAGWDEIMASPYTWHIGFMQAPGLPEQLVPGHQDVFLGRFYTIGKFSPADVAYYLKAYETPAQLHSVFEIYRAFPANVEFNKAHLGANALPLYIAFGEQSHQASMAPKLVAGLRDAGFSHVQTGVIPGANHYVVQDQPDAVAALIEQHATVPHLK